MNQQRRERIRKLQAETADMADDPYLMRNHLGSYECRLCLTLHMNEASYLAHTTGRKHQSNLQRRQLREQKEKQRMPAGGKFARAKDQFSGKRQSKIGLPGFRVIMSKEAKNSLLFEIDYPEIMRDEKAGAIV